MAHFAAADSGEDLSPSIEGNESGTLVCVWSSNHGFDGANVSDYDILVTRSLDGGLTWTDSVRIDPSSATDTRGDWEPFVVSAGMGKWLVVWNSTGQVVGSANTHRQLLAVRSNDDGVTWSEPVAVEDFEGQRTIFRPRAALSNQGNAVVVWYGDNPVGGAGDQDSDLFVSTSGDFGETWTTPTTLNNNAVTDSTVWDLRPSLATDGAGNWVCAWESSQVFTPGSDIDLFFARSTDNGLTWSASQPLNAMWRDDLGDDQSVSIVCADPTRWLAIWMSDESLGGAIGVDVDLFASWSRDGGASWSGIETVNTNAAVDTYGDYHPVAASDGSGRYLAVWFSGDSIAKPGGDTFDIFSTSNEKNTGAIVR